MALDFFRVNKKGIDLDYQVQILCGSALPGSSGTDSALVNPGSLYTYTASSGLYQKISAGSGTDKWVRIAQVGVDLEVEYAKQIDEVAGSPATTYFGRAAPGASTGASVWLIQRITEQADGDTAVEYANGVALFDQAWTNRLIISYS